MRRRELLRLFGIAALAPIAITPSFLLAETKEDAIICKLHDGDWHSFFMSYDGSRYYFMLDGVSIKEYQGRTIMEEFSFQVGSEPPYSAGFNFIGDTRPRPLPPNTAPTGQEGPRCKALQ